MLVGGQGRNRTADTRIFKGFYTLNGSAAIRNIVNNQAFARSQPQQTALKRTQLPLSVTEKCQTPTAWNSIVIFCESGKDDRCPDRGIDVFVTETEGRACSDARERRMRARIKCVCSLGMQVNFRKIQCLNDGVLPALKRADCRPIARTRLADTEYALPGKVMSAYPSRCGRNTTQNSS